MIEKGKISALQLAMMFYISIIVTGILFLPIIGYHFAERDYWIAPILSSIVGFMMVIVMCKLNNYYPKETIIQYSCSILGKVLGKIIGAADLITCVFIIFHAFWSYASFVNDYFLPYTPKMVILGSLVLICAFAARGGVEVIGRLAELITPLLLILFIIMFSLTAYRSGSKKSIPYFGTWSPTYYQSIVFLEYLV